MSHFAELDENNIVLRVIVVHNNEMLDSTGVEQEALGQAFCTNLLGGNWKQTSYNGNIRKNYAGVGFTYDPIRDVFIPPQPFPSWTLGDTCQWNPPVPYPTDNMPYFWNEETQTWTVFVSEQVVV
jgi:hypothetical protein